MHSPHLTAAAMVLAALTFAVQGQNVTSITQSGNKVLVNVGSDVIEIAPFTDWMVGFEYKVGGRTETPNEYIDPKIAAKGAFTSVQTTADPAVITGPNYSVKVGKAALSIEFLNSSGTSLFKSNSNGFRSGTVSATIVSGDYYGVHNGPSLHLETLDSTITINGSVAGEQGWARSPLAWTPAGFGVYFDKVDAPSIQNGTLTLSYNTGDAGGNFRLFLIAGTPRQVMQGYYAASAPFPMPPKYAMGFMNSEWKLTEPELKTIVGNYRSKKIPIDLYILDYDWWKEGTAPGGYCWDETNFPSAPSGGLKTWMDGQCVKMMGIRKPWFTANGQTNYIGFFDSSSQNSYWRNFIREPCNPYARGIIAYWNDEADNGLQDLGMQKGQYLGQRAMNNKRVYSLNRCYQGGAHRYAYAHWSGDISTDWVSFSNQRKHMLSSVNLGCAWWAQDIGGFHGTPNSELYIRWMQMGVYSPTFRVHGSQYIQRQPWVYGTQAEAVSKDLINLRYRLLPYINNAFHRLNTEGLPPVRALAMDYPSDPNTANYVSGWMFGDDMLASPVFVSGATTKRVYLPAGTWYDFWTGAQQPGGTTITADAPIDRVPAYVKVGAIVPMGKIKQYTYESVDDTLEIRVYPGANGQMTLYEDDDSTYAYETGASTEIPMIWNDAAGTLTIGARTGSFPEMLANRVFNIVFVAGSHGAGVPVTAAPDQRVNYTGAQVVVTKTGVTRSSASPSANTDRPLLQSRRINGETHLTIAAPGSYLLTVTSLSGKVLGQFRGDAGTRDIALTHRDFPAGVYVFRLVAGPAVRQMRFTVR